jgi:cell division GTPase FtsZ
MDLSELLGSSAATAVATASAVYGVMYKMFIKPIKDELDINKAMQEKEITDLRQNLNAEILVVKEELKKNSEEDTRLRESFIELKAKHDQQIEKIDDVKKEISQGFTKIFSYMEKRQEIEAKLSQEIALLKQKSL